MSIYTGILTGGTNSHQTTSEEANNPATDFVTAGVVGAITNTGGVAPATGAFAVNAQGTPDMTVAVSSGVAYVTATPSGQASQKLRVYNNASANVTIAANSSGSTKYDWIYIKVDAANAANPNTAADNVATLVTSRSSSATVDDGTPPTYGYAIAVVTVTNGASSITNGNIADSRVVSGTTAAKINFGSGAANVWWEELGTQTLAVAGDVLTVSSLPARRFLRIIVHAINTGGTINAALTFNSDTGANYAARTSNNGGADATATSQSNVGLFQATAANPLFILAEVTNTTANEKLIISSMQEVATGAGSAPGRLEAVAKWANTSAQISTVTITNTGTGDYAIGSKLIVLGHN